MAITDKPEQPTNSPWEAVDKLEALSEQPKSSSATEENLTPIIESKTKVENSEVVGQPLEQLEHPERRKGHNKLVYDKELRTIVTVDPRPEQPNTELLIVKTIQGLTTCINNELDKLVVLRGCMPINNMMVVIDQAIEDIASFEKNELYELQKAFE